MILASKEENKKAKGIKDMVRKKNLFSIFVHRLITMSQTLTFGSKGMYIISSMWDQKISNNSDGREKRRERTT